MAPGVTHPEDFYRLVTRPTFQKSYSYSVEERKNILEFQRVNKISSPEVTMMHASHLLQPNVKGLGEDVWVVYEQMCLSALHLGHMGWAAFCIEKLNAKFPNSKRVKRIYALYRESVGEWREATDIYRDILKENPESTYSRKRSIIMKRQQGKCADACEAAMQYLQNFGTDKEVWHELGEMYVEQAKLTQALFCYEDLILQDARNLYYVLTYAELLFSLNQCPEHIELSRKYFSLALHIDESNLRGLWGLFLTSVTLFRRDQGAEKLLALQQMCLNRIHKIYTQHKSSPSSEIMLEVLQSEMRGCEESLEKKKG